MRRPALDSRGSPSPIAARSATHRSSRASYDLHRGRHPSEVAQRLCELPYGPRTTECPKFPSGVAWVVTESTIRRAISGRNIEGMTPFGTDDISVWFRRMIEDALRRVQTKSTIGFVYTVQNPTNIYVGSFRDIRIARWWDTKWPGSSVLFDDPTKRSSIGKLSAAELFPVEGQLNIAESNRGTFHSARYEGLSSQEATAIRRWSLISPGTLNDSVPATVENARTWQLRHQTSMSESMPLGDLLAGRVTFSLSVLDTFRVAGLMYLEGKHGMYEYEEYLFQDAGGTFTLHQDTRGLIQATGDLLWSIGSPVPLPEEKAQWDLSRGRWYKKYKNDTKVLVSVHLQESPVEVQRPQ